MPMVSRTILPHQTGTIEAKDHRLPLESYIMNDLIEGTLQEG
jgi:hypothetical protein